VAADKTKALLEAVLRPGDRLCLEGDNQKQVDFLADTLASVDSSKIHDPHMVQSGIVLQSHMDPFVTAAVIAVANAPACFAAPGYESPKSARRGVGELACVGAAGAIANTNYHATGKQIRHLPIHVEDLI
jgi:hypothetical protein